jgi:hypothetical protein
MSGTDGQGAGKNGVSAPSRRGGSYSARPIGPLSGTIEMVLAVIVLVGVFSVAFLVFRIPGPLVVQVRDDLGAPIRDVRVTCTALEGGRSFRGETDVFGEAKWPGLQKGAWRCEALAPDRFHAEKLEGNTVVGSRTPSVVRMSVERPVRLAVEVTRPKGAPRAAMAVRVVCPATAGGALAAWEARSSPLGAAAVLWMPHGRECRAGLVHPELDARAPGLVARAELECTALPCSGPLEAGVGGSLELKLDPTLEQWTAARPAPVPEPEQAQPVAAPAQSTAPAVQPAPK